MTEELYFCLKLTTDEHSIMEGVIRKEAARLNCKVLYYRTMKNGHVAMFREVKLEGETQNINRFKDWIVDCKIDKDIESPYK
jgi:hypothetical protein